MATQNAFLIYLFYKHFFSFKILALNLKLTYAHQPRFKVGYGRFRRWNLAEKKSISLRVALKFYVLTPLSDNVM